MLHFYKTPWIIKRLATDLIWNIETRDRKEIYVTFDDGPIPRLTEFVLDTLSNYKAKGTFFCVGENISKYPEIFAKIISGDHAVGNHTYNHLKGWKTNNRNYLDNIVECDTNIYKHQKKVIAPLFRPPYGQITFKQIKELKKKYKIIMWDVLAYDFGSSHTLQRSLNKLIRKTASGSIVVFHDNYKAESKLKYMLPKFLEHFLKEGYEFKKIEYKNT